MSLATRRDLIMTEFRQHPLYTNYYVSSDGRYFFINSRGIKSDIKQGTITRNRYGKPLNYEVCITLEKGKYTTVNVGRLVLETYVGFAPDDKPEIDHVDRNPLNNDLSNLRWSNRHDNMLNRKMPAWSTDRQARRLETAKKMGYNSWGDLIKDKRRKARLKREQETK